MVLRRLFERREAPPADASSTDDDTGVDVAAEEEELAEESPENVADVDWRGRALQSLPSGVSTGSKRPEALYGREDAEGPTHFVRSMGCRAIDSSGRTYIDC